MTGLSRRGVFWAVLWLCPATVFGKTTAGGGVRIAEAWARASIGTGRPAAAYVTIVNGEDAPVTLTGAGSPAAGRAYIHHTTRRNGVMGMEPAGPVAIGAGETLAMAPGGLHIMLSGLAAPLVEGRTVPLSLRLADGRRLTADARILGPGARGPAAMQDQ